METKIKEKSKYVLQHIFTTKGFLIVDVRKDIIHFGDDRYDDHISYDTKNNKVLSPIAYSRFINKLVKNSNITETKDDNQQIPECYIVTKVINNEVLFGLVDENNNKMLEITYNSLYSLDNRYSKDENMPNIFVASKGNWNYIFKLVLNDGKVKKNLWKQNKKEIEKKYTKRIIEKKKELIFYRKPKETKHSWYAKRKDKNGKRIWIDWNAWIDCIKIKKPEDTKLLPKKIQKFIPKWEQEIERIIKEDKFEPLYIKYAEFKFIYKNKVYSIHPTAFKNNTYWPPDEILFIMASDLRKDLESIGCLYSDYIDCF